MLTRIIALGLIGIASAGPPSPPYTSSDGFRLVVDVLDESYDFKDRSIQFKELVGIHTGAGFAIPAVYSGSKGSVWYQNGTDEAVQGNGGTTVTDIGMPPGPASIQLVPGQNGLSTTTNNVGYGTAGVQLSPNDEPLSFLNSPTPGYSWLACNSSLAYYEGRYFVTLNQTSANTCDRKNIPEGCAPIRLYPECSSLPALPEGSLASHQYAQQSRCYADVSSYDWATFHPQC